MQRRRPTNYTPPAYPDVQRFLAEGKALARTGLAVGIAFQIGCRSTSVADSKDTGTLEQIDGDIADTASHYGKYDLAIPAKGSHEVALRDPYGHIDYHVDVVVLDSALASWAQANPDALLSAFDALLQKHPLSEFAASTDFTEVQEALRQAMADAWWTFQGNEGSGPTEDFLLFSFVLDDWSKDQIDGDVASAR